MTNRIKTRYSEWDIPEETTLEEVRRAIPLFFDWPGKRSTYEMYRGFLITRYTIRFSIGDTERKTVIYGVGGTEQDSSSTFHAGNADSTRQAKKRIDAIIENGTTEEKVNA